MLVFLHGDSKACLRFRKGFGDFCMLEKLIALFKGNDHLSEKRRLRRISENSLKNCEFCFASADCDKRVCKNCLSPFAKGLSAQKWIKGKINKGSALAGIDSVKYARGHGVSNLLKEGCRTFQKLTLRSQVRAAN